ncbi:MAG: FAD-binding oxidoreductase [Flavobacteriales bacterium]|jgi:glycine oxidase|nr:FAD-binding oxidoreductase [Flavobacteriales bacterium]
MTTDYLIVGLGIAGLHFCEQLEAHNKRFIAIDNDGVAATKVSGGVYNPVVLKRFTAAWNASKHIDAAVGRYSELEKKLETSLLRSVPVYRIFKSIEEQNDWMVAGDKQELSRFLASEVVPNTFRKVKAPFGFGKVLGSGKIDPSKLLAAYKRYLTQKKALRTETFQYELLQTQEGSFQYKDIKAHRIIFSEGAAAHLNPYFPKQYLIPNKGEYLIVHAPQLDLDIILKGPMFVIPLGNNNYKVGATYSRDDLSTHPTQEAKEEIVAKLQAMIDCDFTVVEQIAGVRPTTPDRKPLLGSLAAKPGMYFFNGLGTRGIMNAPTLAEQLYRHIEHNETLSEEIDIRRFY